MNYEVTITESSKELNARDRIRVKDFSNAVSLDDATQSGPVLISYDYHVLCHVHNDKSDNPEYDKCVVVDPSGTKYVTGSAAFILGNEPTRKDSGDSNAQELYHTFTQKASILLNFFKKT